MVCSLFVKNYLDEQYEIILVEVAGIETAPPSSLQYYDNIEYYCPLKHQ